MIWNGTGLGNGRLLTGCLTAALVLCLVGPAAAQEQGSEWDSSSDEGGVGLRAGIGFTADPGTFLMGIGFPLQMSKSFAVGPHIQFGLDDDRVILSPGAQLEFSFDTSGAKDPVVRRLSPYVQLGISAVYIHKDRHGSDDDEVGLAISPGFGLEYAFSEGVSVGTNMRFNALPIEVSDEHFYFSWEVGTVRIAF